MEINLERETILNLLISSSKAYSNDTSSSEKIIESNDPLLDVQVKVIATDNIPIIAFRGSDSMTDALVDIQTLTQNLSEYFSFISLKDDLLAHSGFLKSVANVYDKLKNELDDVDTYDLTGHSYGSGMQTIFQYVYFIDTGKKPRHSVAFGSPRVFAGNISNFNNKMDLLRVQNFNDMITYIPSKSVNTTTATSMLVGGALGAYGSKSSLGGTLGSIAGGITSYGASDNYIHVGEAIILFPKTHTPYKLDYGAGEENTGNTNYIAVPKGKDILRNPLDINGFISGLIQSYIGGGFANMIAKRMFPTTPALENFLDSEYGQTALGRFLLFMESADVTFWRQQVSQDLLSKAIRASTTRTQLYPGEAPRLHIRGDFMRMIWRKENIGYIRVESETQDAKQALKNLINIGEINEEQYNERMSDLIDTHSQKIEELDAGKETLIRRWTEWFEARETTKLTGELKEAFYRIHWLYIANMSHFLLSAYDAYSRVQGHKTQAYMDNISLLPYYLGDIPLDKGFSPLKLMDTINVKDDPQTYTSTESVNVMREDQNLVYGANPYTLANPSITLDITEKPQVKKQYPLENPKINSPEIIGFMPLMENLNQPIFVLF